MPEELPDQPVGAVEPTQTQDQPDTDWQKRYTDTHANWNTLNEQLSRFKQDPQAVIEFLRENHPDLIVDPDTEDDDDEDEDLDEDDRPMTRAEFKAWEAEKEQAAQKQSNAEQYETDFEKFVNGRELSDLGRRAIRGTPVKSPEELKAAVDEWFEYEESRSPKPKPRVPHVPANGHAATDVPNWDAMTPGEINQYMAEQVRGHQAQT